MTGPVLTALVIVLAALLAAVAGGLAWLAREHLKLKRDYRALTDTVHGNSADIADLCAATLSVDGYMAAMDERINAVSAKPPARPPAEITGHPYSQTIQKVRGGASVSELMQNSGLSQDEAALLIRLHGAKTPP
jgi:hypothetical protein